MTEENEKLLTIGETAEMLGVSIMTLRRWDESGRMVSFRKKEGGNRYYRKADIDIFLSDLFKIAKDWVLKESDLPENLYCQNSAIFQARLAKIENMMIANKMTEDFASRVVSIAGEIGNNSFDHNLAQWPDVPGIFFAFDLNKKQIVLADRGLGIFKTLKRVKPEIENDMQALNVAFTEIISGRAPEERGNGLKYVKFIILKNNINLFFQTGNAILNLSANSSDLKISQAKDNFHGCLVLIKW
jgi:hypothetical protein